MVVLTWFLKDCPVWRAMWLQAEPGWGIQRRASGRALELGETARMGHTRVARTLKDGGRGEPGRGSSWTGGHLQALLRVVQDSAVPRGPPTASLLVLLTTLGRADSLQPQPDLWTPSQMESLAS